MVPYGLCLCASCGKSGGCADRSKAQPTPLKHWTGLSRETRNEALGRMANAAMGRPQCPPHSHAEPSLPIPVSYGAMGFQGVLGAQLRGSMGVLGVLLQASSAHSESQTASRCGPLSQRHVTMAQSFFFVLGPRVRSSHVDGHCILHVSRFHCHDVAASYSKHK